jgi:carboxypeptidase Taq
MSYQRLEERFDRIARLNDARSILFWDEATMMPAGSGDARNHSVAELGRVIQDLGAAPEIGEWLAGAEADEADEWRRANLREMRRVYQESTVIPADLNRRLTLARLTSEQAWRTMRAANDWRGYQPHFREVLDLTREMLGHLGQARGLSTYDAALSIYSPGLDTATVETLFGEIKSFLPDLVARVTERQRAEVVIAPEGPFPVEAQRALGAELMTTLGFSFDRGRLDVSLHPFCGGTNRDVRITTRYTSHEFISSLMGILHETGHALYEQNLPDAWLTQPVGLPAGMAVHESQSLLHEMQVCRSAGFIRFAGDRVRAHLGAVTRNPESLADENLIKLVTRVKPGLIRVDADEVTYPAHVILRFELERALLDGRLAVDDLPGAWDQKMRESLNLSTLGDDRNGCLQDVHWPSGAFGYFPAYTFGAVIAAQLFARARTDDPALEDQISRGNFENLRTWLKKNVWSQGARYSTLELVRRAAGPLKVDAFRAHLERRYLGRRLT